MKNSSPISALLRWRHFRLSLSLSLSLFLSLSLSLSLYLSLSHLTHLTHNIRSASALPIINRVFMIPNYLTSVLQLHKVYLNRLIWTCSACRKRSRSPETHIIMGLKWRPHAFWHDCSLRCALPPSYLNIPNHCRGSSHFILLLMLALLPLFGLSGARGTIFLLRRTAHQLLFRMITSEIHPV